MRILVVSDTHGDARSLWRAIEAQPTARVVIHLGDGAREAEDISRRYPDREVYLVRGNCDLGAADLPFCREEILGGRRIFLTHGHLYEVKMGLLRLDYAARERRADLVLFGHTHQPMTRYEDGLYWMNPGSLSHTGTYGVVDLTPSGIMTNLVENRI